ncbi:arginase family protein, partial [Pseudoalteromonas sp. S1612]|uniref:arginase family protein n=1 Tax=Pseudoalteromonas sp. S1612 TaxID=579507 RepID=UPI001282CE75
SSGKPKSNWDLTFGVIQHWAAEFIERGAAAVAADAIAQLKADKVDEVYVSFDIDALDAEFAAATGTPEENGLTPQHALDILSAIADEFP